MGMVVPLKSQILVLVLFIGFTFSLGSDVTELVASFKFLNFTFQSVADYEDYMNNKYNENCVLAGIKVSHDQDIFVSVPRWRAGVPATLSKLVFSEDPANSPLLEPFPSWDYNERGNPDALQSVLGFEIDPKNRLWVLDQGKVNNNPAIEGSIKLLIFDLNNGSNLIQKYVFSEELASLNCSFLNDIVLDLQNSFAYISDTGLGCDPLHGGLIVYNFTGNTARRVLNQDPSVQPDPNVWITINGEKVLNQKPLQAGADGIALTPDVSTLFWCTLTGRDLYEIPTSILRNWSTTEEEIEQAYQWAGYKKTASDGLAFSNQKEPTMYATAIEMDGVLIHQPYNTSSSLELLVYDQTEMMWADTIAFDHRGSMLFTSNKLHKFYMYQLNFTEVNYRIWSVFINAGSYLDPPVSYN